MNLADDEFSSFVSNARTFGMLHEVQAMHAAGLALGGSLENAVVIDGEKVLNEDGLRGDDEFVRHKILDAVGDLYLAGLRIIGRYKGVKSGHALHNKLLMLCSRVLMRLRLFLYLKNQNSHHLRRRNSFLPKIYLKRPFSQLWLLQSS